jgi:glycosyltransferase involved in cell wall biosynthesis
MLDFTVAIPTYNGEYKLPEMLESLRSQIGTENISWEIIVVNNNSTDNTATVLQNFQENWSEPFPLKVHLEFQQGAAFARLRAIQEASGELVGFLDDDNIPASDWVAAAYKFGLEYPQAGVYGGQIHPNFEVEPPENFEEIIGFLAIRERGNIPNKYRPEVLSLPPGAAMVVRRQAWLNSVPRVLTLSGKVTGSMVQGDDWEPLMYIYKAGWEIWYNPAMHTYHKIPRWRLERKYLLSLINGSCLSFHPLRMIAAKTWEKPILSLKTVFGNLYRMAIFYMRNGQRIKNDLILECKLEIYRSKIASVFYYFNKYVISKKHFF